MKTLELKDLKHYLGTGLKCQYTGIINGRELSEENKRLNGLDVFDPKYKCEVSPEYGLKIGELKEIKVYKNYWTAHVGIQRRGLKTFINGFDFKPLMLPLLALTEPLPDGSIPMHALFPRVDFDKDKDKDNGFEWHIIKDNWGLKLHGKNHNASGQYLSLKSFEYLYANHLWLGDQSLFETGEIIDKRTLKQTP